METTTIIIKKKVADNDRQQTMTSLEIAELTGKQHNHLMRDIRNMEAGWEKVAQSKFGLGSYKDLNGQLRPCYILTKTECLYIATKFNDEARAQLVIRWQQLEETEMKRRMGDTGNYTAEPTLLCNLVKVVKVKMVKINFGT